jgi:hypothetical protein
MKKRGVIIESNSPWSAPAILVPKKITDGSPKFRFFVDFRALNAGTKFDTYRLPVFTVLNILQSLTVMAGFGK